MQIEKKIQTALDETRMLILGAQILLGFGLRGAFADAFDELPPHSRYLGAVGLVLMVIVVGLLIAPGPFHRIVERGSDSCVFHRFVSDIANLALLPFALALGIDVLLGTEPVFGTAGALTAGVLATTLGLALWYGLPWARRRATGAKERAMTDRRCSGRNETRLDVRVEQMLTEARVILPGAQALFGFQLSIVLTHAFERLSVSSRLVHAASIGVVALSIMLLMAPAAYHRIALAGEESEEMHRIGSWLVTAATLPLALGLAADLHVVIARIAGMGVGVTAGVGGLCLLLGMWYGYPIAVLRQRALRSRLPAKVHHQSR